MATMNDAFSLPNMATGDVKYAASVVEIGPMVSDLLEAGVLILFGEQAPPELREIAVIHDGQQLLEPLAAGDVLVLGELRAAITAVGEMANGNLAELGHLVIKANGASEAELPGEVSIEAVPLIIPATGAAVRIHRAPALTAASSAASTPAQEPPQASSTTSTTFTTFTTSRASTDSTRRKTSWGFLSAWRNWKRRGTQSE